MYRPQNGRKIGGGDKSSLVSNVKRAAGCAFLFHSVVYHLLSLLLEVRSIFDQKHDEDFRHNLIAKQK